MITEDPPLNRGVTAIRYRLWAAYCVGVLVIIAVDRVEGDWIPVIAGGVGGLCLHLLTPKENGCPK